MDNLLGEWAEFGKLTSIAGFINQTKLNWIQKTDLNEVEFIWLIESASNELIIPEFFLAAFVSMPV